jgi:general secretion pathway protein G
MKKGTFASTRGLTLIELIVTMTILGILASAILPLAQMTAKRTKELELRRNLRIIRTAIDEYKRTYDDAVKQNKLIPSANKSGCPETLAQLVEGADFGGVDAGKKRCLRRIPADPFNPQPPGEEPKWGLRSYADEPDSTSWGGEDVFDVYSLSEETALDGTHYKDW